MAMSQTRMLQGLSLQQLIYTAYMLGLPTAGTKRVLIKNIDGPRRNYLSGAHGKLRILSVDMGIRNLAYCLLEVSGRPDPSKPPITVKAWERKDLLMESSDGSDHPLYKAPVPEYVLGNPRFLSKIAFITTQKLLAHQPDVLLIEQQRWRSAGAAGVQEWTIRVNSLENMIWACWRTIQQIEKMPGYPDGNHIDPKKVAAFFPQQKSPDLWLDMSLLNAKAQDKASTKARLEEVLTKAKAKVTKAQKVAIVRGWLEQDPDITLAFEGQAREVADSFQPRKRGTKRYVPVEAQSFGKLDDLADCMLQGVTWYRWQQNIQRFAQSSEMMDEVVSLMRD